ncbi:hypothetical protein [Actinomyces massiliensis]|nr:hypothetical protein [Actinomyces massiliensis]WLD71904.1 hypothetical protein QU670_01205 [Actinomyces massiliensis]
MSDTTRMVLCLVRVWLPLPRPHMCAALLSVLVVHALVTVVG